MAVGLKLAHWGYYAPEWNYRFSQGPWGRAIGQWVPRKWPVYTFRRLAARPGVLHRPARPAAAAAPRFLNYVPGPECHFVLLQAADFANWPDQAPPLTLVARFQDQSGEERILARTPGLFPLPGLNGPRPSANAGRSSAADSPE